MKTGLIAYRQVLRKGGFNLSVVARQLLKLKVYDSSSPLKLSTKQVAKKKFSASLDSFFYQGWSRDGSIWRAQQWKGGGGLDA